MLANDWKLEVVEVIKLFIDENVMMHLEKDFINEGTKDNLHSYT